MKITLCDLGCLSVSILPTPNYPDGNGGFNYEYAIKDLPIDFGMGNTRVMFNETGQVLQDQSYYPFGMSMGEALTFHMPPLYQIISIFTMERRYNWILI